MLVRSKSRTHVLPRHSQPSEPPVRGFSLTWVVWDSTSDSQWLKEVWRIVFVLIVVSFQFVHIPNHGFCKKKRRKKEKTSYLVRITWLLLYLEDIFRKVTRRRIGNNAKLTWKINKQECFLLQRKLVKEVVHSSQTHYNGSKDQALLWHYLLGVYTLHRARFHTSRMASIGPL